MRAQLMRSRNVKRRHLKASQIAAFEAWAEAFLKPTNKGGRPTKKKFPQFGAAAARGSLTSKFTSNSSTGE
jgi:hypothetical protein